MLLKQLLQQTSASQNLLFRDPFIKIESEQLVREVIGLANVEFDGARYLVFGVNVGAMEGSGVVGIAEDAMADLKTAHRLISSLVKPLLHLAFIFDKIDGKLVGALEIDGCDDAPYTVRRNYSEKLVGGHSWVRDGRQFRDAEPADLEKIRDRVGRVQNWEVAVGFNDQPNCNLLKLDIPDTSNPPSANEKSKIKKTLDWKQATKKTLGTINTHIFRLVHVRQHGADSEFDSRNVKTLLEAHDKVGIESAEADNYYFFEQTAVKLDLTICNMEDTALEDVNLRLGFPQLDGFEVVDRLYSPLDDDGSFPTTNKADYPDVQRMKSGAVANIKLGSIASGASTQVFRQSLRLAVGPAMKGKKVGIKYSLTAKNKKSTCRGLLKIRFGQVSSDAD